MQRRLAVRGLPCVDLCPPPLQQLPHELHVTVVSGKVEGRPKVLGVGLKVSAVVQHSPGLEMKGVKKSFPTINSDKKAVIVFNNGKFLSLFRPSFITCSIQEKQKAEKSIIVSPPFSPPPSLTWLRPRSRSLLRSALASTLPPPGAPSPPPPGGAPQPRLGGRGRRTRGGGST